MKPLVLIFLIGLFGCVMPESYLKYTELNYAYSVDSVTLEHDGNRVCLINEYSDHSKYQDASGVYRYEYQFKKTKGGYQVTSLKFYDTTERLIDSSSVMGYAQSITKWSRNNELKEQLFLDKNGDLIQPYYIDFARQTQRHFKHGIWIENYYDANNNPRCGKLGFEIKKQWDTLYGQQGDSMTYYLTIKEIYKLDCDEKVMN